ncbi:hypothetical protein RHGRI_011604 [Rhododendron griersonianum]|uniref:Plant heme peroxidase family profile domain-containing protein n=1 Tax=Rhododendron griersonianum TaxID=479676 RepID=A0AAV6KMY8_9ERIC|nr:hypothetical protein RHGRI_011604 [Rhododendron griersonianum]
MGRCYPCVSVEYYKAVDKCKRKLRGFIAEQRCAPLILRLAFHSAGTYDVRTKTGGPFGTIRYPAELAHGANNGMEIGVGLLEPIKQQFPILSYADFYQVLWGGGSLQLLWNGSSLLRCVPAPRREAVGRLSPLRRAS